MSAQHTPGPWKAESFAGQFNVWPISRKKPDGSAVTYHCTKADAHLIAAAPELLAALVEVMGRVPPDLERADAAMNRAMTAARAAIAKATGEQP